MNITNSLSISAEVSWLIQIKHTLIVLIASMLSALTLPAQAEPDFPMMILGTSANGMRDVSKQDIELSFNSAFTSFSKSYSINAKLKAYDSDQALLAAFDEGKIDGIFGLATNILARENQLSPRMVSIIYGKGQYKLRYLLLVRKADNISSVEQLQGKRISIPKFQAIDSLYLDTLLLRRNQEEAPRFFSEIVNAANSNITINDLFFGRVDAAIVNENEYRIATELNPQIAQKMAILEQSEPFVRLIGALRRTFPVDIQDRAYFAATEFPQSEEGRNVSKIVNIQGIKTVSATDLDTVRALKSEYEYLKNARMLKPAAKSTPPTQKKPARKLNAMAGTTP